jgi:hypothetical protein
MAKKIGTVAGLLVALSLATAGSAAAQTWSDTVGPDGAYYNYAGPNRPVGPQGGYYDYAAPNSSSYYDYYGQPNDGWNDNDGYVVARPAYPPGCGAGEPHC